MTAFTKPAILIFAILTTIVGAGEKLKAGGTIAFAVSSAITDFSGQADVQPYTLEIHEGDQNGAVPLTFSADVKVKEMSTGNKTRDRHMHEMFKAKKHPLINGKVDKEAITFSDKVRTKGVVPVDFTIAGITNKIKGIVTDWQEDEKGISFKVTMAVSLKAFKLKAPRVMGIFKIRDKVGIQVAVRALRE